MNFTNIQKAIKHLQSGKLIIVMDDLNREAEGDLVGLASKVTPEKVNFMTKYARGLMCVPMTSKIATKLELSPMVIENNAPFGTAFTVSVDHKSTTTGISAFDRFKTILNLSKKDVTSKEFYKPGHIFPLISKDNGVLERNGHTEAAVDLAKLANSTPVAYICEILQANGKMARLKELHELSLEFDLPVITIKELQKYRRNKLSVPFEEIHLPSKYGDFYLKIFDEDNLALIKGNIHTSSPVTVRLHSECFTGDVLGSLRCDCGAQLQQSMKLIEKEGRGVILYLRQEGRGIGLRNKLKTYSLQEEGYDTVEANKQLGFKADERNYKLAASILKKLGVYNVNILTNNPDKIKQLKQFGIHINKRLPIETDINKYNFNYLKTKQEKFKHFLNVGEE